MKNEFKNHHHPKPWYYEIDGKLYFKVGAYDLDDIEYKIQEDGSIYCPEITRYYFTLEQAYTLMNREWSHKEEPL